MTPVLATALLSLLQGPYLPAPDSEPPANAPLWVSGETAEEHSFSVTAAFDCPPDTIGGHLQVSISDTTVRAAFSAEENIWRRVLSLRVPARQLRGLRPELYCPEPGATTGPVLRLKSKFTAQGTLVCRTATGKQTSAQTSVALDAWVRCPPLPEKPPATDAIPPAHGNEGVPPSELD
ncbi:MAG: hypothetical protein OXM59_08535 [Gammaproteobacteria bacterium]|nr:hypothetical protein [Gammaproteobacteria bacterium]